MKILTVSILILVSAAFVQAQINSWKGLTPLNSNRADVEKLFGKPAESDYCCSRYETPDEKIEIVYSADRCKEGWDVAKDTVLSIAVSPKSDTVRSFDDLKLVKSDFSSTFDDAFFGTWTNADAGLQYYFGNQDLIFYRVTYIPKKSDNDLRCNGFPPFAPEGEHYPYEKFPFRDLALSRKDNLNRIYALIDAFIFSQSATFKGYKGFILVYFDNKLSLKEYRGLVAKLNDFVFRHRKVPEGQITIIEGGMREKAEVELYLLPETYKPPAPNPTLPSPQFMKPK